MSFTTVMFPIIAALIAPEGEFLERNTQWNAVNEQQKYFLENVFIKKNELSKFSNKELRSWASQDHNELNRIAKENGFDIQLQKFDKDGFGSLSILDIIVKWFEAGTKTTLTYNSTQYKAAKLSNGFDVIKTNAHSHPIVSVKTQSNDRVYMTIADESLHGLDLLKKIQSIKNKFLIKKMRVATKYYDNLIFPVVDINQQVSIDWLLKMKEQSGFYVSQALQQTKFKMDEVGAHVQSAVMLGFEECLSKPKENFVIDKPFYIWIERSSSLIPNLGIAWISDWKIGSIPVFVGYIDSADWQKS